MTMIKLTMVMLVLLPMCCMAFFGGHHHQQQRRAPPPVEEIDLYDVLGIDEDASAAEIKKAFRLLSMKYHPDKNAGQSTDKFTQVSRANEILSDEELKYVYDFNGMQGVKEYEDQKKQNEQHGGGGHNDPFAHFFGHQPNRGAGNKGPSANVDIQVTLEQMYTGAVVTSRISRRIVCRGCADDNAKAKTKERCRKCPGRCPPEIRLVQRQQGNMIFQQQEQVQSKHHCKNEEKELEITVEKGMSHDAQITFKHASEQKPGQVPGDVVVTLKQKKHHLFERREHNQLHVTVKVTLKEALTGFTKELVHLDGHRVPITVKPGSVTFPFQVLVIKGEGMPVHEVSSQFGDLHVTFEVLFPKTLSQEQMDSIKQVL